MAKFGQQFIQGLLQPTYGQGLFTASQQLGAMPRQIQQKKQEKQNTKKNRLLISSIYE